MGMLFQFGALFTDLTVFDNVAFPLREHSGLSESMIHDIVLHALSREDGSMMARLKTDGSAILTASIELDGGVLVQTRNGGLYSVTLH